MTGDELAALAETVLAGGDTATQIAFGQALHDHVRGLVGGGEVPPERLAEAARLLRLVVRLRPMDAAAGRNLGIVLMAQQADDEAAAALAAVLDAPCDPSPDDLAAMARDLAALGVAEAAEQAARRSLAHQAGQPATWVTLGLALHQQQRLDEALAAYETAQRLDPFDVAARVNAAMVHLAQGDLARGFDGFEWRRARDGAPPALPTPAMLAGRRVLLEGEQGHGDTIHFARYAKLVAAAGAEVVLRAQPGLVRLLGRMEGVAAVVGPDEAVSPVDTALPLASLPAVFGTTLGAIPAATPYLHADDAAVARWRARLAGWQGRRIGVAWAGDPRAGVLASRRMDARRSVPLAALAPLAGIELVSLQKGPGARQAVPAGMVLHDWTGELGDFADTAALVAALDLVITVDTSIAHLAGALGRPVWLLNRFDADWRWLHGREDCPWYPTLRQFRQEAPGDWAGVVGRVERELREEGVLF